MTASQFKFGSPNTNQATFTPFAVDMQRHVKMWFSKDGIPEKHQARFIKFRALNPDATLHLIYSDKYLTVAGRENIKHFAKQLNIILLEYETITPVNEYERIIKKSIDQELEYYFNKNQLAEKGNLSVVADRLKLFEKVLELGIQSDCDVEFNSPLPKKPIIARLGIIAKTRKGIDGYEGGLRVSNDLFGGDPKHPIFITAKKLLCEHIKNYHDALPAYFKENAISFDAENYARHPQYFQARNARLSAFSLGSGPQLFAIAFHLHGVPTGYENITVPEVFILEKNLVLKPYDFSKKNISEKMIEQTFLALLPKCINQALVTSWDHSWQEGNYTWKKLSSSEIKVLSAFKLHSQKMVERIPKSPSHLKGYFSYFVHPNINGKRHRSYDELAQSEQKFIQDNETPDMAIRMALSETLGSDFTKLAERFSSDGVLILPAYFQGEQLAALQAVFAKEIAKKKSHPFLNQTAFNAAVDNDNVDAHSFDTVLEAATDTHLQALIKYHFGQNQTVVGMRGYRQEPTAPILYRAWDYHQDLKSSGPYGEVKIMLLINGVEPEGQAMRVMKGTHEYHWHHVSQQQTKYTMHECLDYAKDGLVTVCYGPPGTVILFDTNALHSGHRNKHSVRDIFTISFAPDTKDAPIMHQKFAERSEITTKQEHKADPHFWKMLSVTDGTYTKEKTQQELDEYQTTPTLEQLKERYNPESTLGFREFISIAISTDVNGDLDLPLRKGKEDTARDNQLIAFRDVSRSHEQYKRVNQRMNNEFEIRYDLNIDTLCSLASLAGKYKANPQRELSHCALLALDLLDAFKRIDNRQRLRTTIAYLYFTLDHMHLITSDANLKNGADYVFNSYISTVYLDDLEYRSNVDNHIPNCSQFFKPKIDKALPDVKSTINQIEVKNGI